MENSPNPEYGPSTDDLYIQRAIADAREFEQVVAHPVARCIASRWHQGQTSGLYSFASTGRIDLATQASEVAFSYHHADDQERVELDVLGEYLLKHADERGQRGPVEGWHELAKWDHGDLERGLIRKFGHVATKGLIRQIENAEPFMADDQEYELNRRLALVGKTWQWIRDDKHREVILVVDEPGVES